MSRLQIAEGVATLTLNRPERHNAFDDALIRELDGAIDMLGKNRAVRVVILAGAGKSFLGRRRPRLDAAHGRLRRSRKRRGAARSGRTCCIG